MNNSDEPAKMPKLQLLDECNNRKEPLLAAKAVYEWQQPQCGCLFLPAQQSPMLEPKKKEIFFPSTDFNLNILQVKNFGR